LRDIDITLDYSALDLQSAAQGVHDACKLSEQPISGVLDDPATVLSDLGIDQGAQVVGEPGVRPLFIQAGQAAIASRCKDRCEPSFSPLGSQGRSPLNSGLYHRSSAAASTSWASSTAG